LRRAPPERARLAPEHGWLEVHVDEAPALKGLGIEAGLSYNVREARAEGTVLREVKVALLHPESFDIGQDV
jgi:hypothetical protein